MSAPFLDHSQTWPAPASMTGRGFRNGFAACTRPGDEVARTAVAAADGAPTTPYTYHQAHHNEHQEWADRRAPLGRRGRQAAGETGRDPAGAVAGHEREYGDAIGRVGYPVGQRQLVIVASVTVRLTVPVTRTPLLPSVNAEPDIATRCSRLLDTSG